MIHHNIILNQRKKNNKQSISVVSILYSNSNASSTDKRRVNKQDFEQYLEDGYYKCPNENCDRKYQIKHSLVRHLRHECNLRGNNFSCPLCLKRFTHGFNVLRHLQQVHKLTSEEAHIEYGKSQTDNKDLKMELI
ncbi:histone-lysine N-methyltransferase PRDM16-like [Chironomus tepperi]|uniref:histone-lysine N-methyltransferase PRDM16-like n=1 Tax=Chironomus tepperi TaxID=113505 RepID=UPI00391EE5E2